MKTGNTAAPKHRVWRRLRTIVLLLFVVGLALFIAIRFYYPFGEGIKTGQLNFVVYKGVIFKTYEGRLIQSGFTSSGVGIQSNEFNFSISDPTVAEKLMRAGGQVVELHYREYFGALPWRGYSKYIVDQIVNIVPASSSAVDSIPPFQPQ